MKKLLKVLSVLEILIGIGCAIVAIAGLLMGGLAGVGAEQPLEQQAVTMVKVSSVLGLVSAVFNFLCGSCGLRGTAPGNEGALSAAVKLGWIGLIAAVASAVMTLVGDVSVERIISAVCSSLVPVLFLISAKSVRDKG